MNQRASEDLAERYRNQDRDEDDARMAVIPWTLGALILGALFVGALVSWLFL